MIDGESGSPFQAKSKKFTFIALFFQELGQLTLLPSFVSLIKMIYLRLPPQGV